jgi:hypothetical protein
MLYPVKAKERKLETDEFQSMLSRLYVIKQKNSEFDNVLMILKIKA